MKKWSVMLIGLLILFCSPVLAQNGLGDEIKSLHGVLDQLYGEMIPLCSQLIGVGRGIAAFAAMWYIAARVWGHIARAESIDFYPLFRPFVIGFTILIFPSVVALINGVMQPTVTGTAAMAEGSEVAIEALLKEKERAIKETDVWKMYVGETGDGDRSKWYKYTHPGDNPDDEGMFAGIGNDMQFAMSKFSYNLRNTIKEWMSEVLQVLFAAASLCINAIRTFNLIVLAILGPLVFGLSVFDGFRHTLRIWLARYINVFLWLPVANIFGSIIGKIQENMLKLDLRQIGESGDTFFSRTDMGYLIFMIIGILGYFTVPSVANHILWVGGGDALTRSVTSVVANTTSVTTGVAASAAGSIGGRAAAGVLNVASAQHDVMQGYKEGKSKSPGNDYQKDKLKGNKN